MANDDSRVAVKAVFELLADERVRIVLDYLRGRVTEPVREQTLITYVVRVESETWNGAVPPEYSQYVASDLHHAVLPKLGRHGLVEHDRLEGVVRYRGQPLVDDILRLAAPR